MQRPAIQFTTSFFQKKKRKKEQFGQQNSARHRKCWLLSCWQHNAATRNKVLNALIFQKPIVLIKESRNVAAPIDKRQHNSGPRIGLGTYVNCMQSKTSFLQHVVLEYQLVLQSTTALLSLYINQGSNGWQHLVVLTHSVHLIRKAQPPARAKHALCCYMLLDPLPMSDYRAQCQQLPLIHRQNPPSNCPAMLANHTRCNCATDIWASTKTTDVQWHPYTADCRVNHKISHFLSCSCPVEDI